MSIGSNTINWVSTDGGKLDLLDSRSDHEVVARAEAGEGAVGDVAAVGVLQARVDRRAHCPVHVAGAEVLQVRHYRLLAFALNTAHETSKWRTLSGL